MTSTPIRPPPSSSPLPTSPPPVLSPSHLPPIPLLFLHPADHPPLPSPPPTRPPPFPCLSLPALLLLLSISIYCPKPSRFHDLDSQSLAEITREPKWHWITESLLGPVKWTMTQIGHKKHLDPCRYCATGPWRSCWSHPSSCCGTSWWSCTQHGAIMVTYCLQTMCREGFHVFLRPSLAGMARCKRPCFTQQFYHVQKQCFFGGFFAFSYSRSKWQKMTMGLKKLWSETFDELMISLFE